MAWLKNKIPLLLLLFVFACTVVTHKKTFILDLTRRLSDLGDSTGWVAGRLSVGETLGGAPTDPQAFYPAYVDHEIGRASCRERV